MAKSAGNFERVTELAARGIDPLAFRYLALMSRYRHKLEYNPESLAAAAAGLESLRSRLRVLGPPPADGPWAAPPALRAAPAGDRPTGTAGGVAGHGTPASGSSWTPADRAHAPAPPLSPAARALQERFAAAVDDDLDLPNALAAVREAAGARDLDPDERRWLILDADLVLGLGLDRVWEIPSDEPSPEIEDLLRARADARERRDYARADAIRDDIAERGWEVVDGSDRSTARRRT
jgi:cysteinyl-tRNA synthetase